ncbi:MAG: hypothetical protein ACYDBB_19910 [Armatimonadota bacterium]
MTRSLALLVLALYALSALAQAPKPLATFTLTEAFGVAHPDQIVYFDLPASINPAKAQLVDADGKPVIYQKMANGQLAVRTDLPKGAKRTWSLHAGKPVPTAADAVTITPGQGYAEIANGMIAIRVPMVAADLKQTPSPIQGLRYRDGTWTATGPNYMARPAKSMNVEFLEKGPLVVRVKVSYVYDKGLLHSARKEVPDVPAGEGSYSTTIEMQAGQPSIRFEEECETDISYKVDIADGFTPDRAQYRGHHANSTDAGMDPGGKVYSYAGNVRHDALVMLKYEGKAKDRWSHTSYPYMAQWDPWSVDTGFYWQLYDSAPNGSDNLIGIFAGPASRLIKPGLSGVSFDTRMDGGKPVASLQVRFQRLMPTQYYTTHMRFGWGLFLGKKGTDVKPQMEVQEINRQMNLHSGVNLTKIARLPETYPDPVQGYGKLYAPATAWKGVADALREERAKGGKTLYHQQYNANPYLQPILDYWADPSPAVAKKAADTINSYATFYLNTLVNGQGIFEHTTHYFMGASSISAYLTWTDMLLASELLAPETKNKVKQVAALFGTTLWDNDVVPMQNNCGMNWGPANMSSMWRGTRYSYTLLLANHPHFKKQVDAVRQEALGLFHEYVNDAGACNASAHYTGASMVPILNLMQQMQMSGITDAFATDPLVQKYAEWEMQLMTPPEIRFGGLRKIIAVGDGSTEQNVRVGQLATGLAKGHPALSKRVMGAWRAMGSPQDNFYGPSILKIDPTLPAESPKLGDAHFEGWMSVMRSGWETKDESAVYFINGDTLSDHRHNDMGEVVLYALGAPLSLDFGAMYYPRPDGGLMHSLALPESVLGRPWDADNVPLTCPPGPAGRSSWWNTKAQPFASFSESAAASAGFSMSGNANMQWQRTVRFLHPDPAFPVIIIDDTFSGKDLAGKPVVSTLNMMAQGEVTTPAGKVTPVERTHGPHQNTTPDQLPSAGTPFPLPAGVNKFSFTGQWLIDWDLYTIADAPLQAAIGHWGGKWFPSTEANQFNKAQGRPFEERQHILRLRGQDHMRMFILPYRKGERPDPPQVEKQDEVLIIRSKEMLLTIGDDYYSYRRGNTVSLTAFSDKSVEAEGIRITGGAAEVSLVEKAGTITISGAMGERRITLPKGWSIKASEGVTDDKGEWVIRYEGGKSAIFVLVPK